jgi:hypothetical protein
MVEMAFVPEGRCDRSLARSAWASATQKSRPVGYGLIRAGVRTYANWKKLLAWIHQTPLGNEAMAHSALVSRRFRKRSVTSSTSSNTSDTNLSRKVYSLP